MSITIVLWEFEKLIKNLNKNYEIHPFFFFPKAFKKREFSFFSRKMADDYEDNDFEEDFQEADEPDDLNDDLEAADGDQEQIDVLPAGEFKLGFLFIHTLFI